MSLVSKVGSALCQLCEAAVLSERFYEDEDCWIAECESCGVPMVVWKRHGNSPPDSLINSMVERLKLVGDSFFGIEEFYIDQKMRQIPDHYHAHARKIPSWVLQQGGRSS